MNTRKKIITLDQLRSMRGQVPAITVTNGCFDIVHAGHVHYLEAARSLGEGAPLVVGINNDAGVKALKGAGRPVNGEEDRARVLAGLESVSHVTVFPDCCAAEFLEIARPTIYVKGGDYTLETLHPRELAVLKACGARIEFIQLVRGWGGLPMSTSQILLKQPIVGDKE